MNNSNTNLSTSFEYVFKKHKKIILAIPVILLVLILALYFTSTTSTDDNKMESNYVDTSIPNSETKPLADSKVEVASDYEMMTEESKKKQNEAESINLSETTYNYEKPDDEVINKVDKMLKEMDKKEKPYVAPVKSSSNYNRSSRDSKVENYNNTYEEKNNYAKESLNDFFSSNESISKKTNVINQNDPLIYAVIKGDQIGIKNGQRVVLLLTKNTIINGHNFLKNTIIYAQAEFRSNRVNLNINNINQIPINLKVFDAEDGGLGLNVNQSLIAETGSEVISDGSDEIDVSAVPLGNTIKKLFKKKQQIPKIDLLNNQKLILKL